MRSDIKFGVKTFQERAARCAPWMKYHVGHADLTDAVANEAQAITLFTLPKRHGVIGVQMCLNTAFEDTATAGFNDVQVTVGVSGGDVDSCMTTLQINKNGTEIVPGLTGSIQRLTTAGIQSASASTIISAIFTPAGGYTLLQLDAGSVDFFVMVADMDLLAAGSTEVD